MILMTSHPEKREWPSGDQTHQNLMMFTVGLALTIIVTEFIVLCVFNNVVVNLINNKWIA